MAVSNVSLGGWGQTQRFESRRAPTQATFPELPVQMSRSTFRRQQLISAVRPRDTTRSHAFLLREGRGRNSIVIFLLATSLRLTMTARLG